MLPIKAVYRVKCVYMSDIYWAFDELAIRMVVDSMAYTVPVLINNCSLM